MPGIASINAETTRIEPLLASSSSHDEESDASSEVDAAALVENDDLYDSDIEGPRGHRAIVEVQSVLDEWPQLLERYTLLKKVGEGTFSSVFKAIDQLHGKLDPDPNFPAFRKCGVDIRDQAIVHVALKRVYQTSSAKRVCAEVEYLYRLRQAPCVVPLINFERFNANTIIVLPYFEHCEFREILLMSWDMDRLRHYLIQLFFSMRSVHRENILHRDVKPSNFMYNITTERGLLTDFGLAQTFDPSERPDVTVVSPGVYNTKVDKLAATQSIKKTFSPGVSNGYTFRVMGRCLAQKEDRRPSRKANRAGTRGFRAPEVLFKVNYQTPAIDIWSCGVIMLCCLTGRFPFFQSTDDNEAILELIHLLGLLPMMECAARHGVSLETDTTEAHRALGLEKTIKRMVPEGRYRQLKDSQAIALLKQCLELDPDKRIPAEDAVNHPFFANVRDRYKAYF